MYVAPQLNYDMIIGRDLLMTWDSAKVPMKNAENLSAWHIPEEQLTDEIAQVHKILDAHYEKADLQQVVRDCQHLHKEQQESLYSLLKKYESLFDGTLGK